MARCWLVHMETNIWNLSAAGFAVRGRSAESIGSFDCFDLSCFTVYSALMRDSDNITLQGCFAARESTGMDIALHEVFLLY